MSHEKAELVMAVLDAGMRGDGDAYNANLDRLAEDGWPGMFGTCCALAKALLVTCPVPGEGFIRLEVAHVETGQQVSIERTGMDPDLIAASRIIVAVGNDDVGAAADVFFAAVDAGYGMETVGAVSALVIGRLLQVPKYAAMYGGRPR